MDVDQLEKCLPSMHGTLGLKSTTTKLGMVVHAYFICRALGRGKVILGSINWDGELRCKKNREAGEMTRCI